MLNTIREKTQGILAIIIVGLLIIPFAFWGVNSYFESSGKVIVATVNGHDIGENEYRRTIDQYRNRVDPRRLDNPMFKGQVVEGMVQRALLQDAIQKGGYAVTATQLGALIRNMEQFRVGGEFNKDQYYAYLRSRGMTVDQFHETIRQEKQLDQIVGSLKDSALVSSADLNRILALYSQTRRVETVLISPARYNASATASTKELQSYFEQNKARFQEPERIRIQYIRLSADELIKSYQPTEKDLKAIYEEEKGRYSTPAARRVSHILLEVDATANEDEKAKVLALANDIVAKARKGAAFAGLAKKHSADTLTAKQGGDLGKATPGLLPPELEAVVNKMQKGEISDPVRTEYGYQIAKITEMTAAKTKSLNQVRPALLKILRERKSEERYYEMTERLNNLIYEQPDSLEPAAKALGLPIETSDWFSRDSGASGVLNNPKVIDAAFSDDVKVERRNSESIELGTNKLIALRIAGVKPARQKTFDEVRSRLVLELRQQKSMQRAREVGRDMVLASRKGGSLAVLARKHGLEFTPAKSTSRDDNKLNPKLVSAVFAARRPGKDAVVIDGVDLGNTGYAVFALRAVEEGVAAKADSKTLDKHKDLVLKRRGTEYYYNYLTGLRESGKVKIYYDKL